MIDQRRVTIEKRLREEPTVWLSSTRPDGRPHVVPVWFNWDGHVFDLFSKPQAQKVRNLRAHPDVMLAIGQPTEDWEVELVEGRAAVLDTPTADVVPPAMFDKYSALMARAALDRATFVATYSLPVRITPSRFLGYGGKGWTDPALTPDGDDEVTGHMSGSHAAGAWTSAHRDLLAEIRRAASELGQSPALQALED